MIAADPGTITIAADPGTITIAADPGTTSEFQSEIMPGSRDSEFQMLLTVFLSKLNTLKLHLFNWLRNAINDLNVMQNSES